MFKLVALALFIAIANGSFILDVQNVQIQSSEKAPSLLRQSTRGLVSFTDCGGQGTAEALRVDECEGSLCHFYGGRQYGFDIAFIPAQSGPQVSLRLIVVLTGIDVPILDIAVPDSPVEPGQTYTLSYVVAVDGLLAGQTIELKLEIYHTQNAILEVCVTAPAEIHA